ncbi:Predicted permease, DMT superfamily [Pannonibacter phragmitetus]|uniref:Predicted permease, DMT superfamily n=1 Tax=Pannonibacter phragmitetus TaxID=121719 RepID=A0A378ZRL9_9HYPH|nr:DMT family transporter [Pannonibacter phragmitetus]SUA99892.1 Predicted permease, DMT superfamily [Pannonibacter phragmitetus]
MTGASSPASRISSKADILQGILLMTLAMIIVPGMDTVAKYLSATVAPLLIGFGRFFFQAVFTLLGALIMTGGLRTLMPKRWGVNMLRGIFLAGATFAFFTALKVMPVADAIAIFFIQPMVLTALSAIFLKEQVGPRRWAAVVVGLIGAIMIIRPGFDAFGAAALLPMVTACLFALYLLTTRILAGEDSMLSMQFTTSLGGGVTLAIVIAVIAAFGAETTGIVAAMPNSIEMSLLFAIGAISFVSHGLIVKALALAPASVIAPFNYLEIVSATLFGFLVFGDFPDLMTWAGIALIVASGIYIAHRERIRHEG